MKEFGNPLDNVRVASPCPADWNQMYGTDRVRHCSECRMSVYNLSAMTRDEAEALLLGSEGRLCVRFYRRADGTIITNDCPVGLAAVKLRMRKAASAAAALMFTFLGGLFGVRVANATISLLPLGDVPAPAVESLPVAQEPIPVVGESVFTDELKGEADLSSFRQSRLKEESSEVPTLGQLVIERPENIKVKAWIK